MTEPKSYDHLASHPWDWRQWIDQVGEDSATPADAGWIRLWFAEALKADSFVGLQYRLGRYRLGPDVKTFLWAFGEGRFEDETSKSDAEKTRRMRVYHLLLASLLASYEFSSAQAVSDKLEECGEGWWRRKRHFILWRLWAGAVAGNIALGGSGLWLSTTRAFASQAHWSLVLAVSAALVFVPAWLSEKFQAPPHVLADRQEALLRLRSVLTQAVLIVIAITAAEWAMAFAYAPADSAYRDPWVLGLMASVSLAIGYVVTLIWRERSIAGPV